MKRAHVTLVAVGCVIFAIGVAAWKIATAPPEIDDVRFVDETDDDRPRKSKWFWQDDAPPSDQPTQPVGQRVTSITVYLPDGSPAAGATVRLVRSPFARDESGAHPFYECDDLRHITTAAAALRSGALKSEPLVEAVTDGQGVATFPDREYPPTIVVVEAPGQPRFATMQSSIPSELELPQPPEGGSQTLSVTDSAGVELEGARVTLVAAADGAVEELVIGSSGRAVLGDRADRWAIVEADGYFPQVMAFGAHESELRMVVEKVGIVEVNTPQALGSFAVQLIKRHPRQVKVRDGKAIFEGERPHSVSVEVVDPGFLGRADGELPEGGRLVLNMAVKRAGRLLLTVVDTQGMPVPGVDATFTQPGDVVNASAQEEGARIELGPVGEGPGVLQVTAPGFKSRAQSMELEAGDTELEVVLAEAPLVKGKVVDSEGKPVAGVGVSVLSEFPQGAEEVLTDEEGVFSVHVEEDGRWLIEAVGPDGDVARGEGSPGAFLTLVLRPAGSLVVTVIGADGKPAAGARVLVAGPDSIEPDSGETDETGELTFEQLAPGGYRVEVNDGADSATFLSERQELTIRSGERSRLDLRMRPSATIHAIVVDPEGAPLAFTMISTKDGRRSVETDEHGVLELAGFEASATVELAIDHEDYVALSPPSLKAGSKNSRLHAVAGKKVKGRVVTPAHEPLTEFLVNGIERYDDDGRFEATVGEAGVLEVAGMDGAHVTVKVGGRDDVGEIVLAPRATFKGLVLDDRGQPVASALVSSPAFLEGELSTDASGAFEVMLSPETTGRFSIRAQAGELAAVTDVDASATSVTITLGGPTRIEGIVRGRSVVTTVIVRGAEQEDVQVDTDPQGHFTLTLLPGIWQFGTRANRSFTTIRVSGRDQRVELGALDDGCEIAVGGTPVPTGVFLVPAGTTWAAPLFSENYGGLPVELAPGVIVLSPEGAQFIGRSVPCGSYELQASFAAEVVKQAVSLSRGTNRVVVRPTSLSSANAEFEMPHRSEFLIREPSMPLQLQEANLSEVVPQAP